MDAEQVDRLVNAAANLALDVRARDVCSALSQAGLRSLVIKGPAITQWLYEREGSAARRYSDIDLLVAPAQFAEAERVLSSLGFRESPLERAFGAERPPHAHTWSSERDDVMVDLHKTLFGCDAPAAEVWGALAERTESIELLGAPVEVPNAAARALIVALHAQVNEQHERGHPSEDLDRAIRLVPIETWREAAALSTRLGAEEGFSRGLRLLTTGARLAEVLGLSPVDEVRGEPATSQAFRIAQGLAWTGSERGLFRKTRFLARKLILPREVIEARSPLARRGKIGLVAAHLWRLVRLLRHAPRAVAGWRRSRRAS